ncbi:hypothetical protein T01_1628 [Trichinella spiralis]|uniref:Uncharacterized protein n=1 Tax=Trichinella spiralis TaxID=6334 RepID=A0A0V1AHN7_TRISP|nr:hypothetical protein T01_1628 [Trichinella spiralis]
MAVLISAELVEGTSHDQIVTSNGQTIVLLQRCAKEYHHINFI